jgi:hypothetical protein
MFKMKTPLIAATVAILLSTPAFSATRNAHARHHPRKMPAAKIVPMPAKCPMMDKMDMPMDGTGEMKMQMKGKESMSPDMMSKCMKAEPAPANPAAGPDKDN